jgi:polyphenol oxidase
VSTGELSFELPGTGRVLFTERVHGNMSSVTGQDAENAARSRERLREDIGVRRLVRGRQVHGAVVRRAGDEGLDEAAPAAVADEAAPAAVADGHATSRHGVGAMVLAADCLPVALGRAPRRAGGSTDLLAGGAVAMLHAGWRGLLAGVLEEGVRALDALGAEGETVAVVGPGARVCCYEVGDEVHAAFAGAHRQGGRIDLAALARDRLLVAGVAEVRVLDACTICDPRFFSHRREGVHAGRQAGVAWIS